MNQPKIPKYTDSENTIFHPVFHYALLEVLSKRGLSDIGVEKQFKAPGGGLVDLVLVRKSTGRVILPIEIKRKMSSVRGQGRRQARDYQQNLSAQSENNFYCVSNLELTELFRSDPQRKTTTSQQIELVTPQDVRLENGQDHLVIPALIKIVEEILDIILDNKPFKYLIGLSDLEVELGGTKSSGAGWHESLVPFCYEYIRGTAAFKARTNSWKAAGAYNTNPKRIVDLGGAIDFENIFSQPVPTAKHFKPQILHDAYVAGGAFGDGDDLAALVGDILYDPNKGIVETDYDLARLLAVVAGNIAGDIGPTGEILDPCAGSGKLLAALIHEKYPHITPQSVIAVEKEPYFAEALSLRLGLQFGDKISKTNSPRISIAPFETLSPKMFSKVRIAVVNPPFISGINVATKNHMATAFRSRTAHSSCLDVGQLGFEAMFMELLFRTVPDNTTIAFIFPYTTISRLSREFVRLREFLVNEMGVSHVITYLSDGVFDSVAKRTLIFVCTKGKHPSSIELVDIQIPVPDLDLCAFSDAFCDNSKSCYGVKFESVSRTEMSSSCTCGWKAFFGIGGVVKDSIAKYMGVKKSLFDYAPKLRRGTVGNSGNTALTVFGKDNIPARCPKSWIMGCLNKAHNMPRVLDGKTAPDLSFVPPSKAYAGAGTESQQLVSLVDSYIMRCGGAFSTKNQKTNEKIRETIIRNIKRDQRRPVVNSIIMPRGCREDAKLAVVDSDPVLVSTNFFILPVVDSEKRILLASWLQSVFGQLQIEMYSTSERGLRKLEKNALEKVYVPSLEAIPDDIRQQLVECFGKEDFLSLDNVQPRESDRLWASLLAQDNAQQELDQSVALLSAAYDERVQ